MADREAITVERVTRRGRPLYWATGVPNAGSVTIKVTPVLVGGRTDRWDLLLCPEYEARPVDRKILRWLKKDPHDVWSPIPVPALDSEWLRYELEDLGNLENTRWTPEILF